MAAMSKTFGGFPWPGLRAVVGWACWLGVTAASAQTNAAPKAPPSAPAAASAPAGKATSAPQAAAARAPAPQGIDTKAPCTASCHLDFAKKAYVHGPARKSCTKCHEPTAPNLHSFKPLPKVVGPMCLNCHDDMEERKLKHKPFAAGNCTRCHDPHQSDFPSQLLKPVPALCVQCHDEDDLPLTGKVVHGPVTEGKCLECHDPHMADHGKMLKKPAPELCFKCHAVALKNNQDHPVAAIKKQFDDKTGVRHPPFEEGKCTRCHVPHMSQTRALLAEPYPEAFYSKYDAKAYALCFGCHKKEAFEQPRTLDATGFRNGNLNLHFRHVNRDKGRYCGACHAPHATHQAKLMTPAFQFGDKTLALAYEKLETGGKCNAACHGLITYDRCQPFEIAIRTTPRQGRDATAADLAQACAREKERAAASAPAKVADKATEKAAAKAAETVPAKVPEKAPVASDKDKTQKN